jgi:hypothetical protein
MPTPRLNLPYPAPGDPATVPADIQALAEALDPITATFQQGTAATRPAAGVQGRYYFATDTRVLFYDDGATWRPISMPRWGAINPDGTTWYAGSGDWSATHPATGEYVITPTVGLNVPVPLVTAIAQGGTPIAFTTFAVSYTSIDLRAWNVPSGASADCTFIFSIWGF